MNDLFEGQYVRVVPAHYTGGVWYNVVMTDDAARLVDSATDPAAANKLAEHHERRIRKARKDQLKLF